MATATCQPALSSFGTHFGGPYHEQALLERRVNRRQGIVLYHNRPKTAPPAPPKPELTYFTDSTAGIGESPRSSYSSSHRNSQDRHSLGKFLNFNNPKTTFSTLAMEDAAPLRSNLSQAGLNPIPVPPTRTKHPSFSGVKRDSGDRFSAGQYVNNLFSSPKPTPPLHPYATARATAPATPSRTPPTHRNLASQSRQPGSLVGSTSTPNLRQGSSFAKSEGRRTINFVSETWCDTLIFPRPRLKAHRLSFTPPATPLNPPSRNVSQNLDPTNPVIASLASSDALLKAMREGEERDREKRKWNSVATSSFQNTRSRSLSRSRYHQVKAEQTLRKGKSYTFGVKRGIEVLAESAFSQGSNSHTTSTTTNWTSSHSRNTSLATDTRRSSVNRHRTVPSLDAHGSVESHTQVHGRARAMSETRTPREPTTRLYDKLLPASKTPGPQFPSAARVPREPTTFVSTRTVGYLLDAPIKSKNNHIDAVARPSMHLLVDRAPNSSEIGIAITTSTPNDPPSRPSVRLVGHPYATPNYTISQRQTRTPANSSFKADIPSRHRLPHEIQSPTPLLPKAEISTEAHVFPNIERSSSRNSYLGAYAYGLTAADDADDAIIDFGEALQRSIKRSSGSSSGHSHPSGLNNNHHVRLNQGYSVDRTTSRNGRQEKPSLQVRPPLTTLRSSPAPARYEPVKFDKALPNEPSRGLSPITDVTTPASSVSRSIGSPDRSGEIFVPPMPIPKQSNDDEEKQYNPNESFPVMSTAESSPVSTEEPPLLGKSFDSATYHNLFFKPSRSNSPDTASAAQGSRKGKENEESVGRSLFGMKAAALYDEAQSHRHGGKGGLDIPESIGEGNAYAESEDSFSALGTDDDLDFTLRQVQQRVSITTVGASTPRPLSTHITQENENIEQHLRPLPAELIQTPSSPSMLTPPPDSSARDSSYSATSENSLSRIACSFPAPPTHSGTTTPSTLLEAYFTAPENTPAQSREHIPISHY